MTQQSNEILRNRADGMTSGDEETGGKSNKQINERETEQNKNMVKFIAWVCVCAGSIVSSFM